MHPHTTPLTMRRTARNSSGARALARWAAVAGLLAACGCAPAPNPVHTVHDELLAALPGEWQTCIRVSAGSPLLALARAGLAVAEVPPEARAAVGVVRSVKVSLHRFAGRAPARSTLLACADQVLSRRGWERVVGVIEGREMAAVYTQTTASSPRQWPVCVVVLTEEELVMVTTVGDPEAALRLVRDHWSRSGATHSFKERLAAGLRVHP